MKTRKITVRNYVLMKNRPAGYYHGNEILDCGLMGRSCYYWIATEGGYVYHLYMADQIDIIVQDIEEAPGARVYT